MPTPIIDLQRRLTLVGALRAGGEKPERGIGKKLGKFRITSPRKPLIDQASELYGGPVSAWRSPVGEEWQVYTEAPEIPVLVIPGYSLRQSYELWEGATKRTRLCDGVDEELSGGPCICDQEGDDRCDLYTRLVVALPELDTVLGWRLISRGANAGHELPTMLRLVETMAQGQTFVPARLRLDERRGVKDGQVVRFVVPVLDLGVGYMELVGRGAPALPPGTHQASPGVLPYAPLVRDSPGAVEALDAVQGRPVEPVAGGRAAAPLPDVEPRHEPPPFAPNEDDATPAAADDAQTKRLTDAQAKKLNVLVGTLRDGQHITTRSLYDAIGTLRQTGGEDVVLVVGGYDAENELHWSPLRDSLNRAEASQLIKWLEVKERQVREATVT